MAIKIGNLTSGERREAVTTLTFEENGVVRQEEIRISFKKPTESLWRQLSALEEDGAEQKDVRVEQLAILDLQSPDITNDDGTVHQLTREDLMTLDVAQLAELWDGVKSRFFLQTPAPTPETNTNSTSAQTAA